MTTLSRQYDHPTIKLQLEGESSSSSPDAATIDQALTLQIQVLQGETTHLIRGDQRLLSDLARVLERYLGYQLQAQPQGTFTGDVAIRPLDFLYHRLTARQGEGIVQMDLSMTQLYDLLEAVEEATQSLPPLESLQKPAAQPSWYAQPPAIAALLIAGVGLVAAATLFSSRTQEAEQTLSSSNGTSITAPDQASGEPPDPDEVGANQGDTDPASEEPSADLAAAPTEEELEFAEETEAASSFRSTDQPEARDQPEVTDESAATSQPAGVEPEAPSLNGLGAQTQAESADLSPDQATDPEADAAGEDVIATLRAARQAQQQSVFEVGETLQSQLAEDWQTPADLESDLRYAVVVDAAGLILAVDPQDETSAEQQELTPLADLESPTEVDLPSEVQSFLVIFTEEQITVSPF